MRNKANASAALPWSCLRCAGDVGYLGLAGAARPFGAQTKLGLARGHKLSAVPQGMANVSWSNAPQGTAASPRGAGCRNDPPRPSGRQWGGRDPLPRREGEEAGIYSGFFNLKPAPFPYKPRLRFLGSPWDGLQLPGLMEDLSSCTVYVVQVPEHHQDPQGCPPPDSGISLGKAEIPKAHPWKKEWR